MSDDKKKILLQIGVMTLKEITDLIKVDHSKAMKKIEKLAEEPSFGGLAKVATPTFNPDGSKNRDIETYLLTKMQSIAAAARLNNSMLMQVIVRVEELSRPKVPESFADALQLSANLEREKQALLIENKAQSDTIEIQRKRIEEVTVLYEKHGQMVRTIMESKNLYKATQVGARFGISAVLFNKIMNCAKVIRKVGGVWGLRSDYLSPNPLAVLKEVLVPKKGEDETVLEFAWTARGVNWIEQNWDKAISRLDSKTLKSYQNAIKEKEPVIPKKRAKKDT